MDGFSAQVPFAPKTVLLTPQASLDGKVGAVSEFFLARVSRDLDLFIRSAPAPEVLTGDQTMTNALGVRDKTHTTWEQHVEWIRVVVSIESCFWDGRLSAFWHKCSPSAPVSSHRGRALPERLRTRWVTHRR